MTQDFAKAYPRKRFFVEMFTRDISADDCILDLIDNSIDALIRQQKIDLDKTLGPGGPPPRRRARITVRVSASEVMVEDDCGGIGLHKAKEEIFNFGHSNKGLSELTSRGIGAYGIGLKRAIFKLGRHFKVESTHNGISFVVEQNLEEWVDRDERLEDWRFPIKSKSVKGLDVELGGTRVIISKLHPEIRDVIEDPGFADHLRSQIAKTYGPFLSRFADVSFNSEVVEPDQIPLGHNAQTGLQKEEYKEDGVSVRIVAGPAAPGARDVWEMEKAGWYVVCNGRVVVFADRTELTGWGAGILPQFHSSKGRGFVGVVTFVSTDPLKLPWTTTKRGLNRESPLFLHARGRMQHVGSIVYKGLESLYPSATESEQNAKTVIRRTTQANLAEVMGGGKSSFRLRRSKSELADATIQYRVPRAQLDAVKKHIGNRLLTNAEVGMHTFLFFIEQEGIA